MKNFFTLALLLCCFSGLHILCAQNYSPPEPFSQGQSNKANAFLGYCYYSGFMLLWEQSSEDNLSTSIYYKYFLNGGVEELLLFESGVHFKSPMIFNVYWAADTSSTIVFEKVLDEKTQLCFMKVANDGGFSEPFVISGEGQTNNQFALESLNNYFAWNSNDYLLVSQVDNDGSFAEIDTVFSGPIQSVLFKEQDLFWITSDADSAYLM